MPEDRFTKVRQLFEAAQALPMERRAEFLKAAADDAWVRAEVQSLLDAAPSKESFLETSPLSCSLTRGTKISHFEIQELLGRGGMGEVYRARDSRLERDVAIKVLPTGIARDPDRIARFKREARAASALNHPNVVSIYDIGEENGTFWIVSEIVAGETLRSLIDRRSLSAMIAADIARQIVEGLAAAHAAGIVHRDLKPSNVMVTTDARVKILDFGLAKRALAFPEGNTRELTNEGEVLGTVAYMSPEQVRGEELDPRTDLFSFGVVLYEMVTGQRPFQGNTNALVFQAILSQTPTPPEQVGGALPGELEHIIEKALEKDRDIRYQHAHDIIVDLKRLRRTSSASHDSAPTHTRTLGRQWGRHQRSIWPRTRWLIAGLWAIAALIAGLTTLKRTWTRQPQDAHLSMTITPLTTTGDARSAAISPDGRFVALVNAREGKQSLWLRQVSSTSTTHVGQPINMISGVTFSPDGNELYYVGTDTNFGGYKELYRTPVLGGPIRRVAKDVDSPIGVSPDGRQLVFIRNRDPAAIADLKVAAVDGTHDRTIATSEPPDYFAYGVSGGPSWSPDGETIALGRSGSLPSVVTVPAMGGPVKSITTYKWADIGRVAWLPDSKGLVVAARDQGSPDFQLWQVSYPAGEVRRLTNDANDYSGADLTIDAAGKNLVAIQRSAPSAIWVAPTNDLSRMHRVFSSSSDYNFWLAMEWTNAGQLVYAAKVAGHIDLWMIGADGANAHPFVADGHSHPWVTIADDGTLVFVDYYGDKQDLKLTNLTGDEIRPILPTGQYAVMPAISPDGKWLLFERRFKLPGLWKRSLETGAETLVAAGPTSFPRISPDGKLIAYTLEDEQSGRSSVTVVDGDTRSRVATLDFPDVVEEKRPWQWAPDGLAITYRADIDGVSNIWSRPLNGGSAKQLTHFDSDHILSFAWSRDGKQLAVARGIRASDVVLIQNFR